MAEVSPTTLTMLLTIAFMSMLSPAGLAQFVPLPPLPLLPPLPPLPFLPPSVGANPQCWSSLASIQGCIVSIFKSFSSGKIGSIDPACCDAITHIPADCWPPKLFPADPVFPKGLKTFCSAPPPLRPSIAKKLESELLKDLKEIKQYWSSIISIDGCVAEIFKSFRSGKIGEFGSACCKAISAINDKCWPQIFPIDPFFPPLIKQKCGTNSGAAAPPQ